MTLDPDTLNAIYELRREREPYGAVDVRRRPRPSSHPTTSAGGGRVHVRTRAST